MKKYTKRDFVRLSRKTHGKRYDYSKSIYKNRRTKVEIICSDHGSFFQRPDCHYHYGSGCPICGMSAPERRVFEFLKPMDLCVNIQHEFSDLVDKNNLRYDFCVTVEGGMKMIEYHGRHHYESIAAWGGEDHFEKIQKNDKKKRDYCVKNNIPYLEIHHSDKDWKNKITEFLK